jgi:hypothetical protein
LRGRAVRPREITHVLWPVSICLLFYLKLASGAAHYIRRGADNVCMAVSWEPY